MGAGVAKASRFSLMPAQSQQPNGKVSTTASGGGGVGKIQSSSNHHSEWCWWRGSWRSSVAQGLQMQCRKIRWSLVCGLMLFALGMVSLFTGHMASDLEWYSQRLVKRTLYSRFSGIRREPIDIWKSKYSKMFYGCSERGRKYAPAIPQKVSNGYLLIAASGGLNQERTGITDAVVVARFLNATLVVPELDHQSYWKDDSDFVDIFDVDWFISYLAKDVTIVKRVPDKVMRSMDKPPYTMRVPRKSPPEYYMDQVLPILSRRKVLQLTKFDYRLGYELDEELQRLRCRVNYHALRFTKPIREIGQKIVMKMKMMATRFIAIHLRSVHGFCKHVSRCSHLFLFIGIQALQELHITLIAEQSLLAMMLNTQLQGNRVVGIFFPVQAKFSNLWCLRFNSNLKASLENRTGMILNFLPLSF